MCGRASQDGFVFFMRVPSVSLLVYHAAPALVKPPDRGYTREKRKGGARVELTWENLENAVRACRGCGLCERRLHTVLGEGNPHAGVLFVGEGPGRQEDEQGRPFVGPAGQLLDRMLAAISLTREMVYIANIVKCRPPGNREPTPEEAAACLPYLRAQFVLIRPKILVCLGRTAAMHILRPDIRITRERGIWVEKKGTLILPTYHPSALLRDETGQKKREAWQDLKSLREKMREMDLYPKEEKTWTQ